MGLFAPHFDITSLTDDSIHEVRDLTTVSTHTIHLLGCISNLFHGYSLAGGSDIQTRLDPDSSTMRIDYDVM